MKSTTIIKNDFALCGEIATDAVFVVYFVSAMPNNVIAHLSHHSRPRLLYLWDIEKKEQIAKIPLTMLRDCEILAFSSLPNGCLVIAFHQSGKPNSIMILDVRDVDKPKEITRITNIFSDSLSEISLSFASLKIIPLSDHEILCTDYNKMRACILNISTKEMLKTWQSKEEVNYGLGASCFINGKFLARYGDRHGNWAKWRWINIKELDQLDTLISKGKNDNLTYGNNCSTVTRSNQNYILKLGHSKLSLYDENQDLNHPIQTFKMDEKDCGSINCITRDGLFVSISQGKVLCREFLPLENFFQKKEKEYIQTIKASNFIFDSGVDTIIGPYLFFRDKTPVKPGEEIYECKQNKRY